MVDEIGVLEENHRPTKLDRIMLYRVHLSRVGFELTTLLVILIRYRSSKCTPSAHIIIETRLNDIVVNVSFGLSYNLRLYYVCLYLIQLVFHFMSFNVK
jgi:hypothetical protein